MPPLDAVVVLCAVPADFDADRLATDLIQKSLAACVQLSPGITSIYRWQGAIERAAEKLIVIKTRASLFSRVESTIRSVHPYDVPEIIALPVSDGHAPYLAWIAEATTG